MGIANGIVAVDNWLVNSAINVIKDAIEAVQGFLGIHSRSQLTYDLFGKNMALGVVGGWTDTLNVNALQPAMAYATSGIGSMPVSSTSAMIAGSGSGGSVTVQVNYAPTISAANEYELADKLGPAIVNKLRQYKLL